MTKKLIIKNVWLGFLSWLVPFVVSIFFFKPGGNLMIDYDLFKSLMIVIGGISGCYLLYRYFKYVANSYVQNGLLVGCSWFAINILLDSVILIPMMKVSFITYFMSIGMRYILIPTISITMGYLLKRGLSKQL